MLLLAACQPALCSCLVVHGWLPLVLRPLQLPYSLPCMAAFILPFAAAYPYRSALGTAFQPDLLRLPSNLPFVAALLSALCISIESALCSCLSVSALQVFFGVHSAAACQSAFCSCLPLALPFSQLPVGLPLRWAACLPFAAAFQSALCICLSDCLVRLLFAFHSCLSVCCLQLPLIQSFAAIVSMPSAAVLVCFCTGLPVSAAAFQSAFRSGPVRLLLQQPFNQPFAAFFQCAFFSYLLICLNTGLPVCPLQLPLILHVAAAVLSVIHSCLSVYCFPACPLQLP